MGEGRVSLSEGMRREKEVILDETRWKARIDGDGDGSCTRGRELGRERRKETGTGKKHEASRLYFPRRDRDATKKRQGL